MSHLDMGQKAIKSPACPGFHLQFHAPHPYGKKLPDGMAMCPSCEEALRAGRMAFLPANHPDYPRSGRSIFGPAAEARRIAQQRSRTFGTPDGQVANTNLVPPAASPVEPMPNPIDTTPLDGMVDDGVTDGPSREVHNKDWAQ